jgi:hypothetical protein
MTFVHEDKEFAELADYGDVRALADDMLARGQIASLPSTADPALAPDDGPRWAEVRRAHAAIGQMFWGRRTSLEEACATVRAWISATFALLRAGRNPELRTTWQP